MKHFIILSSSYYEGKRIGIHYIENKFDEIEHDLERINSELGDTVAISTHYITTELDTFKSVTDQDSFFENVKLIDTLPKFIKLIKKDRVLSGLDIAKYVLSKEKCTHLKLQKLIYFCYADYIVSTKNKLFDDTIYAFQYGPVIKSVYERYKGTATWLEDEVDIRNLTDEMPARSRILFADNGIEKLDSIGSTLDKYSRYTATQLVELTHEKNSPWDVTDKRKFSVIEDEVILTNHRFISREN